jgi:beta-glucosidase
MTSKAPAFAISRRALLIAGVAIVPSMAWASESRPAFRNQSLPVADRVKDLLSHMTIEEKVAQLRAVGVSKSKILDANDRFSPDLAREAFTHGIGQIGRPSDRTGGPFPGGKRFRTASEAAQFVDDVQRYLVTQTRLGIPALFHEETAHGLMGDGATIFPVAPGLGSSWDVDLIEAVFTVTAREARARGVTIGLSPVLDLARDPRFGRVEEMFGEDPYLVSQMGVATIRGLQGRQRPLAKDRVFATLKHLLHGSPEGGINLGPADLSERTLREVYLPPFAAAVSEANPAIIMPSYNEVQGVPAHASKHLLLDLGRRTLGFTGLFMSDYNAVTNLIDHHSIAANDTDAAEIAVNAGIDVELPEGRAFANLPLLVRTGRIPVERLDESVARVLALKFEAGLFERPFPKIADAQRQTNTPAHIALARKAAQKGLVLLTNNGILPLDPRSKRRIAVIGPNAAHPMLGGYSGSNVKAVGILEGIRAALGPGANVEHEEGVWITDRSVGEDSRSPLKLVPPADNAARIAAATRLAERSDVIVLVVGDNEVITREALALRSTPLKLRGDRSTLNLFGDQDALVEAMLVTGKPIIALLLNGRALAVTRLAEKADALIEGWYLGEQGGMAFADVLFGSANPSGKLTVTIPRSAGALPVNYDRQPSAVVHRYLDGNDEPLFPFGFGLSYTSFAISTPRLQQDRVPAGSGFTVIVDVTNTGKVAGEEVVQVYVRDDLSSVPRPVRALKAFRKIALSPGEVRTVQIDLPAASLSFLDADLQPRIEPGTFTIFVGNSSAAASKVSLTVV